MAGERSCGWHTQFPCTASACWVGGLNFLRNPTKDSDMLRQGRFIPCVEFLPAKLGHNGETRTTLLLVKRNIARDFEVHVQKGAKWLVCFKYFSCSKMCSKPKHQHLKKESLQKHRDASIHNFVASFFVEQEVCLVWARPQLAFGPNLSHELELKQFGLIANSGPVWMGLLCLIKGRT